MMVSIIKSALNGLPNLPVNEILERLNNIVKKINLGRLRMSLNVAKIDKNVISWQGENFGLHRIYGGQVMAQSLIAAYQTIEKKHFAHSFHSYFLRPGLLEDSILFDVDSIRDG